MSTGGTHYPLITWDEGFHDFQVKLPEDMNCDQCIFQVKRRLAQTNVFKLKDN